MKTNFFEKPATSRRNVKLLGLFVVAMLVFAGCSKEDDAVVPNAPKSQLKAYTSGTNNGFFYSLYWEGGSASISFPSASQYPGNFQINYSNVNDVVGGKGWSTGGTFTVGYNIGSLSGSYNFVGVYGWTTNPLIEFYVVEKGSVPGSTRIGTLSSDGHTYTVYKNQRVNAPSIQGTATFWQYISNWGGAPTGQNGKITMANHVNYWRSNGGQGFGSFNYMIFGLEAWGGRSGSINATVWRQ
ncbi:MAG: glycoside hydrolase family 11 protein [Bacteroidales bacterium]|nr:glycoside hydrolase family 11 protein [Bacteroidales bacterium]